MYKDIFNRLPDNYSREGQVNNEKFYQIIYSEFEEVKNVFEDIRLSKDIDSAIGKSLDLLGKNVSELRATDDDEIYREFIKTKIIANLSQGDIETINKVADFLLKDKYIESEETWNNNLYDDLVGLVVKMYPNYTHIPTALKRVKAAGVKLFFETVMKGETLGINVEQKKTLFDFPLITNEFTTGSKKAEILQEPIFLSTRIEKNQFEFPLCNEFTPQGNSNITTSSIKYKTDTKITEVIYPLCGEFLVGEVI